MGIVAELGHFFTFKEQKDSKPPSPSFRRERKHDLRIRTIRLLQHGNGRWRIADIVGRDGVQTSAGHAECLNSRASRLVSHE
jgi:hypothetical protein